MPDSSRPDAELNTWQEISAYLRVSIREAQNWEKKDGMPVHRMPGRKSRVKAYPAALDAWKERVLASRSNSPADPFPLHERQNPVPSAPNPASRAERRIGRRAMMGGIAVAGASVFGVVRLFRRHAAIARADLVGNTLCAWDARDRELWAHPFPQVLRNRKGNNGMLRLPSRRTQIADLYGDGRRQILFAAGFLEESDRASEELYCFSSEGKIIWRYRPDVAVTFGDRTFAGPWIIGDMIVAPGPQGSVVWLSLEHWNWRPGAVLALDPDGRASLKFVNGGHLYALSRASLGDRNYIVACGVNNEYACAAMAIVDEAAPPSCSPQLGADFGCVGGPKGRPDRYFLLPPSELTLAGDQPYNVATWVKEVKAGFVVETREISGENAGAAIYRFSNSVEPLDVTFDGSWAAQHRRLQEAGKLAHSLQDCPQLKRPIPVRRWDAKSGWTTVDVPQATGARPEAYRG